MTILRRIPILLLAVLVFVTVAGAAIAPVLRLGGGNLFIVRSGSMVPTIPVGAALVSSSLPAGYVAVGDIVTVRLDNGRYLTHRVSRTIDRDDGRWFELHGDANERPDRNLVPASALVGRIDTIVPAAGYFLAFLASLPGRVAILSLGLFLVLLGRLASAPAPATPAHPSRRTVRIPTLPALVLAVALTGGVAATAALFTTSETVEATFSTGVW